MLHNYASGPAIGLPGRILLPGENTEIGPLAGPAGRRGRFGCFPGRSPAKIRPGRPISGPVALWRNIEYYVGWKPLRDL